MILDTIVVFVLVALFVYIIQEWVRIQACNIPGPPRYPIVGNALMFLGKPNDVLMRLFKISWIYKRFVSIWIGPKLHIILFDAKDVEIVLKDKRAMLKADEYNFLRPWLGDSLLLSSGKKFRTIKKILLPAFNMSGLKNYIELFNKHSQYLVKLLEPEVGKEEFDIQNYLFYTMLAELLESIIGVNYETLGTDNIIAYGKAATQLFKISHLRSYKIWLRPDILFRFSKLNKMQETALNLVHRLADKIINKRKEEWKLRKEKDVNEEVCNVRRPVVLDYLLDATTPDGRHLTHQEIKDEILTLLTAGQDTTSTTIGFALSLLGLYTDVQDKVYTELQNIFGDSDRQATFDDLQQMEYMERVIQETWRLYPPVPLIARKPTEDIPLESYIIPKGCTLTIISMLVHRNPKYFKNPHKFDPDNFLPERTKKRHPYAFIPFSGGIRSCIGGKYALLNIKITISTLLRQYRISSKRREVDFKLVGETTLKRAEGYLINIQKRKRDVSDLSTTNCEKPVTKDVNSNIY